jgi:hypothetical protein
MTISLNRLQEIAEDFDKYPDCESSERHYRDAMNPTTALALIRAVRLAKEFRYDELKQALEEIEL